MKIGGPCQFNEGPTHFVSDFFLFSQVIPQLFRWTYAKFKSCSPDIFLDMAILACLVSVDFTQHMVNVNSEAMFTVEYLSN